MKTKKRSEIAQSMKAAAGKLGVELYQIQTAKNEGCDAFMASGRIDLQKLAAWLRPRDKHTAVTAGYVEMLAELMEAADRYDGPPGTVFVGPTPRATIAVWAALGLEKLGASRAVAVPVAMAFMGDLAAGRGDDVFAETAVEPAIS